MLQFMSDSPYLTAFLALLACIAIVLPALGFFMAIGEAFKSRRQCSTCGLPAGGKRAA